MGVSSPLCDMTGIPCISATRVHAMLDLEGNYGVKGVKLWISTVCSWYRVVNSIMLKMRLNLIYFIKELTLSLALNIATCSDHR